MGKKRHNLPKATEAKKESTVTGIRWLFSSNYMIVLVLLGGFFGWLHGLHIWTLFENDKHFSHLSTLERDLAFRTEMGLYYSYYKTVIEAPSAFNGLQQIMYDNVTEFPSTINVLKRFNLYPELILGVAYRMYDGFAKFADIKTQECWRIDRGELPAVMSCEGFGDPHYFYVHCIYFINAIMMSVLFFYGCYLSGNTLLGGFVTVAFYFFNHGEATRVMWTPPLRESYSFPFLIVELLLVTHMLKTNKPNYMSHMISICTAAFLFMLPWQFAQFALLTQTACIFAVYVLEYIGSHKVKIVLHAQMIALILNFIFQCGNEMLLTSFYASSLLAVFIIVHQEDRIESKIKNIVARCIVKVGLWLTVTLSVKKLVSIILQIEDDKHIGEIFASKFTDFNNFHTMLYTCAKEFDFIEMSTIMKLTYTLLIPICVFITIVVACKTLYHEYQLIMKPAATEDEASKEVKQAEVEVEHRSKPGAEVLYNVLQMLAFTFMAVMIMRLKLFMTPMMCICASLLANNKLFGFLGNNAVHKSLVVMVIAVAAASGFPNLNEQWNIIGEFSNWPHEEMLTFINEKMPSNAVFAGAMPTTASIKLSCQRAIVNHPHYEDAGLRERTMKVYSMYSRQELGEVRDTFLQMGITHFVLEDSWCIRKTRDGCQMPEIWDIEQPWNKGKTPACAIARRNPSPYFTEVFKNGVYTILKVNKK